MWRDFIRGELAAKNVKVHEGKGSAEKILKKSLSDVLAFDSFWVWKAENNYERNLEMAKPR